MQYLEKFSAGKISLENLEKVTERKKNVNALLKEAISLKSLRLRKSLFKVFGRNILYTEKKQFST